MHLKQSAEPRLLRDLSRVGILVTSALHAGVVASLLAYQPVRSALLPPPAAPILVDWIGPPKAELNLEAAAAALPKPGPVTKRRVPRPIEPPSQAPTVAPEAPASAPPAVVPVAPTLAPPAPTVVVAAPVPAPPPVAVTPAAYQADYLQNPAPAYPALSRRMGEQGRVILRVHVDTSGGADEVHLQSSSGYARLDETARETVRHWTFTPARRGTDPVPAWVLVPISFTLKG
jgi:protein TonB